MENSEEEKPKKEKKVKFNGDMTRGNPWKCLIMFALPVLLGSIMQQLYSATDAVIVGHVVGANALGAIGATGSLVSMLIALFMGLSSGSTVVVANYFGRKDPENVNKTVHTAMVLAVISGLLISVLGIVLSPYLLKLMGTPQIMMKDATVYLQIFFAGMVALAIYNMGASILQAMGNSRYPMYFLIISTVINIVGGLLLVMVCHMGVAGAAIATVFSEIVSAILVLIVFFKTKRENKLSFKKLKIDKTILKRILGIGLPGALQQSIVSISNVMVQSYINGLGVNAVAGYAAENRFDAFMPLPIGAMALATSAYVGQNLGAGEEKRARKGVGISLIVGISSTAFLIVFAMIFHNLFFGAFSSDPVVLSTGWAFGMVIIPGYVFQAGTQILPGALRGAGKVKFSMLTAIFSFVVVRQVYLAIIRHTSYSILTVALCYPCTWFICAAIITVYYLSKNHITAGAFTRIHILHTDGTNADFLEMCKELDVFQNANVPGRSEAGINSVYNSENLKDIFLLYDDKKVIGSAGLFRHDDHTCEVVRVFVEPNYHGKGYTKRLINEVQTLAKTLGYKQIHLRTFSSIQTDVEDFKEIGFASIDPNEFEYVDKYPQALGLAPLRTYMRLEC